MKRIIFISASMFFISFIFVVTPSFGIQKMEFLPSGGFKIVGEGDQVSSPVMPAIPATKVAPIVSLPLAGQHPAPCPERIEKTIIKETKEVVVLPKGMKQIKSLSELKKLKKGSKIWKDWDGKMYELK